MFNDPFGNDYLRFFSSGFMSGFFKGNIERILKWIFRGCEDNFETSKNMKIVRLKIFFFIKGNIFRCFMFTGDL